MLASDREHGKKVYRNTTIVNQVHVLIASDRKHGKKVFRNTTIVKQVHVFT